MMLLLRLCIGSLVMALASSPLAAAPVCKSPHGAVAQTICDSPEYRAMVREIDALTDRAKAHMAKGEMSQLDESAARYQRQRDGCAWAAHNSAHPGAAIDECVRASLEGRVRRLRDVVERSGSDVTSR